ncbi:MAG: GNAT family N-acetyltransferase [Myxococcales bacterium]|nr:GNAT family N-acetyltransferase [Myxococcales bacterium]
MAKTHRRRDFDCGCAALNDYLALYARQADARGESQTYVAARGVLVLGFATTAAATMLDSGGSLAATKLLRFAVDRSFQGYGVGDRLMDHVFELARADGHAFVLVDAKHCSNATTYYRRLGFELVEHQDAVEGCDTMVARVPAASPTSQP